MRPTRHAGWSVRSRLVRSVRFYLLYRSGRSLRFYLRVRWRRSYLCLRVRSVRLRRFYLRCLSDLRDRSVQSLRSRLWCLRSGRAGFTSRAFFTGRAFFTSRPFFAGRSFFTGRAFFTGGPVLLYLRPSLPSGPVAPVAPFAGYLPLRLRRFYQPGLRRSRLFFRFRPSLPVGPTLPSAPVGPVGPVAPFGAGSYLLAGCAGCAVRLRFRLRRSTFCAGRSGRSGCAFVSGLRRFSFGSGRAGRSFALRVRSVRSRPVAPLPPGSTAFGSGRSGFTFGSGRAGRAGRAFAAFGSGRSG